MKKILYIICLVILSCNLNGCDLLGQHEVEDASIYGGQVDLSDSKVSEKTQNDSIEKVQDQAQEQARIANEEKKISELQTNFLAYKDSVNKIQTELNLLKSDTDNKSGKGTTYILLVVELFLLLGGIFYLLSKIEGVEKRFNKWRNSVTDNTQKSPKNPQPWQSQTNEREIRELKTAFNSLKCRVEALEKKLSDKKSFEPQALKDNLANQDSLADNHVPAEPSAAQVTDNEPKQPTQPTNSKVFYMPRTSEQNRFEDNAKKYGPDDTTYFKFTMISGNKAEFEFDCDDSLRVKRSFDSRKESIMTVCEIMPGSSTNPKECHTVKKGEAELHDNVWIVKRKAQILYR